MSGCPCGSDKPFGECCGPLLEGQAAETPEALMRSRYTAFTLGAVDYLLETHHPRTRAGVSFESVAEWAASEWLGLKVVQAKGDTVSFEARFGRADGEHCHRETSRFSRLDGRWYYLDGVETPVQAGPKVGRNDPCPCGSGKKFKKCCGG